MLLIGGVSGSNPDVAANTLAAFANVKPQDYGSAQGQISGSYSLGVNFSMQPVLWAGAITNAKILGFQWTSPSYLCTIRRIYVSVGCSGTGTAGVGSVSLFAARGYYQQFQLVQQDGTNGNITAGANVFLGANGRLNARMPPSQIGGLLVAPTQLISAGGTLPAQFPVGSNIVTANSAVSNAGGNGITTGLSGGVLTQDSQALNSVSGSAPTTAGVPIIAPSLLYWAGMGDYPLVFDPFTGFVLQATMPGISTSSQVFNFGIRVTWDETPTYY